MKVLIIDDDVLITEVVTVALTDKEFTVLSALTGKTGFDKAKLEKPDIIILDQILPDISGIEVLTQLKEDLETKYIPVVMFTDYGDSQTEKQAYDLGAKDYILKFSTKPEYLGEKIVSLIQTNQETPVD